MKMPPEPLRRGPRWLRAAVNDLRAFALAERPLPGLGLTATETPYGKMLSAVGGDGIVPVELRPFELVSAPLDGALRIRVVTSSLAGGSPTGFSPGDDPPFVLDVPAASDAGVVAAKITISGSTGLITDREIIIADGSIPADTSTTFHEQLGSYSIDEDDVMTLANSRYGPVQFYRCGLEVFWY